MGSQSTYAAAPFGRLALRMPRLHPVPASAHDVPLTTLPSILLDEPLDVFWVRCENQWSPCVARVKSKPIVKLCQRHSHALCRQFLPPGEELEILDILDESIVKPMQHAAVDALRDAHAKHKDARIADFFTCARVNRDVAVALGATKKARQQAVRISYAVLAAACKGMEMPEWAPDALKRLAMLQRGLASIAPRQNLLSDRAQRE